MDDERIPNDFDDKEMRDWLKQYGPGILSSRVEFDRERFFRQRDPFIPRRRWLEWGSVAALILILIGGAHLVVGPNYGAAGHGASVSQLPHLPSQRSSAMDAPAPAAGAVNAPAKEFSPLRSPGTVAYDNPLFHFLVVVPSFFSPVKTLSSPREEVWQSRSPLAKIHAYGQSNSHHATVNSWISQLGPENLLQQGTNWVLASHLHMVNDVKMVTEEKIYVGKQNEDILQVQYPLKNQGRDRQWVQHVLQSFVPGPL